MIKVSILYPNDAGAHFDWTYYVDQHLALIQRLVGDALLRMEVDEGVAGATPGSPPVYLAALHLYFDSLDAFYASFGPHAGVIVKDVKNYTNLRPSTQIASLRGG